MSGPCTWHCRPSNRMKHKCCTKTRHILDFADQTTTQPQTTDMKKSTKTTKTTLVDPDGCSPAAAKLRYKRTLKRYRFMRPPHPATKFDGIPRNRLSPNQLAQLADEIADYESF